MRQFNNPLDNIRIASPCKADWNEMYGDERKRHCGECKLNVYNLSDMTRREAENLLINSEGRLCVRFYRRTDGTVLTKNCPVGWQAVKQRVSRVATAAFSMIAGLFSGIYAFNLLAEDPQTPAWNETTGSVVLEKFVVMGEMESVEPFTGDISPSADNFEVGIVKIDLPAGKTPNKPKYRR